MSNWHDIDYLNHSYILSHDHLVKAAHRIHPPRVGNWYVPSPLHIYRMAQGSIPLGSTERPVVAVASGLESLGYTVNIYTLLRGLCNQISSSTHSSVVRGHIEILRLLERQQ